MRLVDDLGDAVHFYKVGYLRLFNRGLRVVEDLEARDKKVFLDLKFWDVPNTVGANVRHVADLGVSFVTVHGNGENIAKAKEATAGSDLKILAVTILTSLNRDDVQEIYGVDQPVGQTVLGLANYLLKQGCDGVVASAEEAGLLRDHLRPDVLIVTPGIRDDEDGTDDHKRVGRSEDAIRNGADYIVVGRPIYTADDPRAQALKYIDGIRKGLAR